MARRVLLGYAGAGWIGFQTTKRAAPTGLTNLEVLSAGTGRDSVRRVGP